MILICASTISELMSGLKTVMIIIIIKAQKMVVTKKIFETNYELNLTKTAQYAK